MADIVLSLKQRKEITKAISSLNKIRAEIQLQNPDKNINWYLEDSNNLNLMEEETHDDNGNPNQHAVVYSFILINSSGGGW